MNKWNKNRDNMPCEGMYRMRKGGLSFSDIAAIFGTTPDRVYEILRRRALRKDKQYNIVICSENAV